MSATMAAPVAATDHKPCVASRYCTAPKMTPMMRINGSFSVLSLISSLNVSDQQPADNGCPAQ
jgi:hypothetical protein